MINDHVSDMITRIRNAQRASFRSVDVTVSNMNKSVLEVLKREGFIDGFELKQEEKAHPLFKVALKYYSSGKPVIGKAQRISKAGCRKYFRTGELPRVHSGLGIAVVSTSRGVLSDREARKLQVGGEVIALIG